MSVRNTPRPTDVCVSPLLGELSTVSYVSRVGIIEDISALLCVEGCFVHGICFGTHAEAKHTHTHHSQDISAKYKNQSKKQ